MKEYKVNIHKMYNSSDDIELRSIVQANSFADAFSKKVGDYTYREVASDDEFDICIKCGDVIKYFDVRFG